jgi:WG containing repeat
MKKLLIFFLGLQASSLYATDTTLHWITRPILDYSDVILCKNRRVWLQHANRSWSLASDNGQIIKTNFEKVTDFDATEQGHAVVKQGGQWCIIDKNGMIIRSLRFENQKIQDVLGISGGLIGIRWASQKASWTFADTTGQLWQNASYEDIRPFSGGIGAVKKNGRWRLINRQQKVLTASKYEDISTFGEGLISVSLEGMQKGLWGYVNANGEIQISFQYFFAGTFAQNRATAQFWDGYQYQCGSINHSGEWVISPQYRDLEPFSEDLAAVRDSTGKWGFIDTAGNQVIKPCFDAVTAFQHNKAWVLNGDKWGILEHPLRGAPVMIRWHHSASTVLHVKEAQYKLQVYLESQQPIHRV